MRIVLNPKPAGQHANDCAGAARLLTLVPGVRGSKGDFMRKGISRTTRIFGVALAALALFASGYVAGQNKFGQPKTIIHMVILKWNPGVSDADKQSALEGVKDMAAKVPGVKNVWIKAERLQPRDFSAAFAIEFQNRAAADAYAESPVHQAWEKKYTMLRESSISEQVTNP
jgi:hypothetical protein